MLFTPLRVFIQLAEQVVAFNVAPLGHRLRYELHVCVLLEELEHGGLARPDVALDGDDEGAVVGLHLLGGAHGGLGPRALQLRHAHRCPCHRKMSDKLLQIPHHLEGTFHF